MTESITPKMFSAMFISGAKSLEARKDYINELNVFPVPDGDTGTNMSLTLESALKALFACEEDADIETMAAALSSGALRGARGNSGVIMSQIIRGFSMNLSGLETIDKKAAASAAQSADKMARKAVANPKEGTILTVCSAIARKARELCGNDDISMEEFLKEVTAYADYTLSLTPEMLPVLKEAGVVDSGGQGLVEFMKGACEAFAGNVPEYKPVSYETPGVSFASHAHVDSSDIETSNIVYAYCTEFIVNIDSPLSLEQRVGFKKYLENLGDSLVFVCTDDMVKIHVHTNHPGLAFEKGLEFGTLTAMKIDNMKEEHYEKLAIEEENRLPLKEYEFVCVCSGEGIKELFKGLSVDNIIEGGQTMNPSAEDIAAAVRNSGAAGVFVLPNNSNVILTANQAKELCPDIDVYVIPTKNITEGICAVINYLPALSLAQNAARMEQEIKNIKTAEITCAVRDSEINGVSIKKDDFMALSDGRVIAGAADLSECALNAVKTIADEDTEIISIYYGEDTDEETAGRLAQKAGEIYSDADIEVIRGMQPVYRFIISAE